MGIHAGLTHGSSVYIMKYVSVVSICCCRVLGSTLGSGDCILVTVFRMIKMIDSDLLQL